MRYFDRLLSLSLVVLGSVSAAPITGFLWAVPDTVAQNAILANVPGGAPNVTFQVNSPLNFTLAGSVNTFLMSGGAFNIAGSAADLSRPLSNGITGSILEFTGFVSVTNGQQFTATHDDGLTLIIGGVSVINVPGASPPTQTTVTYSGPSGNLPFTLVYGECCDATSVLQVSLPFQPTSVPEPGTFVLIAGGLISVGLARRLRLPV